jgi:Spy/CpxP family protein refolding chaperone
MKKRTYLLAIAGIGILVLAFSLAYAQPPDRGPMKAAEGLNLTADQIESIKEIRYNFEKTEIGLRADLKTSRLELRHLMMQKQPDRKEIAKLVDRIADTQKQLLKNNVDRKLSMKEVLTQEQFDNFMKMRGERGKRMMKKARGERQHHSRRFCPHGEGRGF